MVSAYISIFLISGFRLFLAMGLGAAAGINTDIQLVLMGSGSVLAVGICILLGEQVKRRWLRWRDGKSEHKSNRKATLTLRLANAYGLWGLAAGTLLLGTIPSVAVALIAGYSSRNTFLFLAGGKLAWILFYLYLYDSVFTS